MVNTEAQIADYPFNGNANDLSGNNHHGTIYGAILATDRFNNPESAYSFDGINDYIEFDNEIGQFGTFDFSVSFWIKTTSSNHMKFIGNRPTCNNTNNWEVSIYQNKMRGVVNEIAGVNIIDVRGDIIVTDGNWHHIVFTRHGNIAKIYVDCVLDEAETSNQGVANVSSLTNFRVGLSPCSNVDDSYPYTGNLDDIKIYDYEVIPANLVCECSNNEIDFSLGNNPMELMCPETITFAPIIQGGSGNYQFQWTLNDEIVSYSSSCVVQINSNSTLQLTVSDNCGQLHTEEIELLVAAEPMSVTSLEDISVGCFELISVTPIVTGGIGACSYTWYANNALIGHDSLLQTTISEETLFTLNISDQCGTELIASFNASLNPSNISVDITTNDFDICHVDEIILTANVIGAIGDVNFNWNSLGETETIILSPPFSNSYSVTVTDACSFTATDEIILPIIEQLSLSFPNAENDFCTDSIYSNFVVGGIAPYSYSFDEEIIRIEGDNFVGLIPDVSTDITVTDQCGNSEMITINLISCAFVIPNIFTPNGDGSNDFFYVKGLDLYPESSLYIYNRWGNLIFKSTNYRNQWSGSESGTGTYYYVLNRADGKSFTGHFDIAR